MSNRIFFVGSYTQMIAPGFGGSGKGIYTVSLNSRTGEIELLHSVSTVNPSYLVVSSDQKYLYSVSELEQNQNPKVKSYKIREDFSLEFLNEQEIPGAYACHIVIAANSLLIPCYGSGNVLQFPLGANGEILERCAEYYHEGKSIDKERQEGSHPHQVYVLPDNKNVLVADLGIDTLKAYKIEKGELVKNVIGDVSVSKGSGPRHMVFNQKGDLGYLLNELTGVVNVLHFSKNKVEVIDAYYSLPKEYVEKPSGSAIRIHPNGQFLYVGNRGFDAVTIFKIDEDKLELIDYQYTSGKTVREFNLTKDGSFLIACHQDSNDTVVYKIRSNGELTEMSRSDKLISPVCIAFR